MTTPIIPSTTYPQYERQYVDPSAAKLEELIRRFMVPLDGTAKAPVAAATEPGWTPAQNALHWAASYGQRSAAPTSLASALPSATRSDYGDRGWAGRLTRGSGQVRPAEMSSIDLMAEANELGIAGTMVMPRPVLEKAVETMRKQRQQAARAMEQQTDGGVLGKAVSSAGAFAVGAVENFLNVGENFLGVTPGIHGVRGMLGTVKAKLRLSQSEEQATAQDRAMAVGEFLGPFVAQGALFKGLQAMFGTAAGITALGGASKFLTGWRGGVAAAGATNLLWNSQYKDMPMLPDAEQWAQGMKKMSDEDALQNFLGGVQIAGATLNSRLGSMLFDMGLGAVLGRWQSKGATALPQAAQPTVPSASSSSPTGFGVQVGPAVPHGQAMPPMVGPQGPLAVSPLSLVNTADGVVGPLWTAPVAEDLLAWKPSAPDVAPHNMAPDIMPHGSGQIPMVRSTGFHFGQYEGGAGDPMRSITGSEGTMGSGPQQLTAKTLVEQSTAGEAKWQEVVPVPAQGENEFPNWQNLPSARLARANGSVLTKSDGSLIALFHEGPPFTGQFNLSGKDMLSGPGVYFRDRADVPYAEFSEKVGYGVQRTAASAAEFNRINELASGLQTQIDNMESALKLSGKQPKAVVDRIAELRAQMSEYQTRMAELEPLSSPATHPVFAIVRKPFYFDSAIPREKVDEILNVIRTNDTFEGLRESLRQTEGEFDALFKQGPGGSTVDPLASQFHHQLSNLWQDTPDGIKSLYETGQVNQLLQAAGYDAIHNIGGMRSDKARAAGMFYNAWNLLDPEHQVVRVFAPPPMAAEVAEQTAVQLSKQAAVVESPLLLDAAEKAVLSDADVVTAQLATNPYGVQIVRGVKDPGSLMQQVASKSVGLEGIEPSMVRMIPRELSPDGKGVKTYDVMISAGQPITDQMAADYAKHGVFEGMHGVSSTGKPNVIVKIFVAEAGQKNGAQKLVEGKTYVVTRKLEKLSVVTGADGVKARTNVTTIDKFLQNRVTHAYYHPQDPAFATLVGEYMDFAMKKLGVEAEDLLSVDAMRKMPTLFQEFAASKQLSPAVQRTMSDLVEGEMHSMARELMGDEFKMVDDMVAEAIEAAPVERLLDIPQSAQVRGLSATREPGTPRWILKGPNATRWIMEDEDAAMNFLRNYTAAVPDVGPGAPLMPEAVRSGMPDTHFTMPPSLSEQLAAAEGSETLARAGINAAKLEENLLRDALGGQYGLPQGPAQPASALPPLPPAAPTAAPAVGVGAVGQPVASPAGPLRGQPPLPPPPPTPPVVAGPAPAGGQGGGGVGPLAGLQPQLQALARNVMSIERELTSFSMQHVLPSSFFFDRMEKLLFNAGAPAIRPGQQMETMRTLIATFYNESEPHIAKLTKLMDRVTSTTRRKGEIWRALDLPIVPTATQPVSRAQYMLNSGFTQAEQQVVGDVENMLVDVFQGNRALADRTWSELKLYVNMVEQNIVNGAPNPYRVPQNLTQNIQHFVEHAERRQLRLEVPETGNIMYEFLRSYYWDKNVKPQWDQMQAGWRALSRWQDTRGERVLAPVADHVLKWMNGVENGFMPKTDQVVNALQSTLDVMGIPLTKQETMQMISGSMSSAYRALLGWNPASTIRDSLQFMGAAPWTGFKNLQESLLEVIGAKGQAVRQAVWQRGLAEGWTELGIPPHPGTTVHQSAMLPGAPPLQSAFTPSEEARRELAQHIGDFFRDMTPSWLRSIEGTKLDPLWAYTNQGVMFRLIVANAASKRIDQVLAKPQTIQSALREMGADVLSFAQRRNIEDALTAGNTSEARKIYTNTVTNTVMNRYGLKEGAVGNHTVVGRIYSQLGGHSSHQLAAMVNLVSGGFTGTNASEKAVNFVTGKASPTLYKMMATMGILGGALYTVQQKTGWNMMKMHPLNWAANPNVGGPLKDVIWNTAEGIAAAPGALLSDDPRQNQLEALRGLTELPGQFVKLAGAPAAAYRLASGVAQASTDGQESLMRYLVTGDKRPQGKVNVQQGADNLLKYLEGQTGTGAR